MAEHMTGSKKLGRRQRKRMECIIQRFHKQKRQNLLAKPGKHDCIIVLDGLKPNYNIGKIFRTAEAFGSREIHLIDIDFFDPSPAKGSFKWIPAKFHDTFQQCYEDLIRQDYTLFILDPEKGEPLQSVSLPKKSAFVFGHEEFGFSFRRAEFSGIQSLRIPQYGKVQSLNVSVAASIVMYEYVRQNGLPA